MCLLTLLLALAPTASRAQFDDWADGDDAAEKAPPTKDEDAAAEKPAPAAQDETSREAAPASDAAAPAAAPAAAAPAAPAAPAPRAAPATGAGFPEMTGARIAPQAGAPTAVAAFAATDALSEQLADEAEQIFEARIARNARLAPFDVQRILLASALPPGTESVRAGRLAFEQGKGAYEMLDLAPSKEQFKEAVRKYVEGLPALGDFDELIRALIYLGATHFLSGERELAHQAFKHILVLRPDYHPDASLFSPPLVEAFDGARWEVSAEPKGQVTLTSRPANAQVWVDDVYRGTTPLTLEDLTVGTHYVVVRQRAYAPESRRIKVTPDARTVDVQLPPGSAATLYASYEERAVKAAGPDAMPDDVGRLATMLAADRLVLGRVSTKAGLERIEVVSYDVRASRKNATDVVELDTTSGDWRTRLVAFADRVLGAAAAPAAVVVAEPTPARAGPAWAKSWWFWTATGVGAALLAGGAVALAASQPAEGPRRSDSLIVLGIP